MSRVDKMKLDDYQKEQVKRHREEGRSEQEIEYYLINKQKDFEPLLKDPETPESVMTDIVDRITLVPLKLLAIKHPNISDRSIYYLLEKADRKKYQKELIAELLKRDDLTHEVMQKIRDYYNKAGRFDSIVTELLNENADISTNTLEKYLGTITFYASSKEVPVILSILNHKNSNKAMLKQFLFTNSNVLMLPETIKAIKNLKNFDSEIATEMFSKSNNDIWLSDDIKDIFLF